MDPFSALVEQSRISPSQEEDLRRSFFSQDDETPTPAAPSQIPVHSTPTPAAPSQIPVHSTPTPAVPSEIPVHSTPTPAAPSQIPVHSTPASPSQIPVASMEIVIETPYQQLHPPLQGKEANRNHLRPIKKHHKRSRSRHHGPPILVHDSDSSPDLTKNHNNSRTSKGKSPVQIDLGFSKSKGDFVTKDQVNRQRNQHLESPMVLPDLTPRDPPLEPAGGGLGFDDDPRSKLVHESIANNRSDGQKLSHSVGGASDTSRRINGCVNFVDILNLLPGEPDRSIGDVDILEIVERSGLMLRPQGRQSDGR